MIDIDRQRLKAINLKDIMVNDKHWNRYSKLVHDVMIPFQWDVLNNRVEGAKPSGCLQNYRIVAGDVTGQHSGVIFTDSDLTKWLEGVSYSLESNPDEELEKTADLMIDLLERSQQQDGYLNTYFTVREPGERWTNMVEGHELYCAGHLIEAAVAYFDTTGKDRLLQVAVRFADYICKVFGTKDGQIRGYPGHQEIELALIKLYYTTGCRKYLDQAMYFINERGGTPNYFLDEIKRRNFRMIFREFENYDPTYSQSHMPPRDQKTAEGHAVRAMYMYSAMADLAYEYADDDLMSACKTLWKSIVTKRMYITGSIGSSSFLERFTADYDLPNEVNYSETCASVGLMLFASRMASISRDASYFDVVERVLYNTLLAGLSYDGTSYFYVNPLEVWPQNCIDHTSKAHVKTVRQKWFEVACCPTNITRTLASLGKYIIQHDEESLYLNLYIGNSSSVSIKGTEVGVDLESSFLTDGNSILTVSVSKPVEFGLNLRIPEYVRNYTVLINNAPEDRLPLKNGYLEIYREWTGKDTVEIQFEIKAEFVAANPEVRADAGKVAIVKGPLVYCLEEADNGKNLQSITVDIDTPLTEEYIPDLFGGTAVVKFKGRKISNDGWTGELYKTAGFSTNPIELTAIPYSLWGNRGENEMIVWLKARI